MEIQSLSGPLSIASTIRSLRSVPQSLIGRALHSCSSSEYDVTFMRDEGYSSGC